MKQNAPLGRFKHATERVRVVFTTTHEWLLYPTLAVGFVAGLLVTVFHEAIVPLHFELDAKKIWWIASGAWSDFEDQSFTPVAMAYRALGMGDSPFAAGLFGFSLATAVILLAVFRLGRPSLTWPLALLVLGAFGLSGLYLGQYSKDVFILPVIALLMLPGRLWRDLFAIAAMLAYAYWCRTYWALIAVAYLGLRLITLRQVRIRYLLTIGALGAVAVGAAFFLAFGHDPNHFRTMVQGRLTANTIIGPIEPFAQPFGGLVDVFVNYWLLLVPATLPFSAGPLYLLVTATLAYVRLLPLIAVRSAVRWPAASTLEGSLIRRGVALLIAFAAVQALFEPDYGSALRHLAPLLPLGIAMILAARAGRSRARNVNRWNWSGAVPRTAADN